MATGPYFLFGAQGLVAASVLFHFASYPDLDVTGMAKANLAAAVFTVAVAWLLGWLLPPRQVTRRRRRNRKAMPSAATRCCWAPPWPRSVFWCSRSFP